ncbi:hypothetical protein M3J09_012376 [Ascochyta lentis]
MAGYGNRTAPDYTVSSPAHLSSQHAETRYDVPASSAPTYGAGFGNKRASLTPTTSEEKSMAAHDNNDNDETGEEPLRFDTQHTHGSAPYSHAHTYGSASTAGAGYGNKTGSFSEGAGERGGKGVFFFSFSCELGHLFLSLSLHREALVSISNRA